MSILDLEKRLNQSLDRMRSRGEFALDLPQPFRLQAQLVQITQKFRMLENNKPALDKILSAIEKFEQTNADNLTRRDWKNIAWGLSLKFDHRPQKLLFLTHGRQAIEQFQQTEDISTSTYLALLFSYFTLEQSEIDANSSHWMALRTTLKSKLPIILKKVKYQSEWMQILNQHPELLENNPTRRISKVFLENSDNESITELTEKLRIPSNGWFWHSLITEVVLSIFKMTDQSYIANIETLLALSSKHQIYKNLILSNLLDRYAQTKISDQVHEVLKTLSLNTWGNPQLESTAGWINVKPETKAMVIRWFVKADLEAFFNLFNQHADQRRFNYWLRFLNKISSTHLILGTQAIESKRPDQSEFKQKNRGSFSQLHGSTFTNNAFIIQIGNIYIVEFSETGNATFVYNRFPYAKRGAYVHIDQLKNKSTNIGRLLHNGDWEWKFSDSLSKLGIFPDNQNTRGGGNNRY